MLGLFHLTVSGSSLTHSLEVEAWGIICASCILWGWGPGHGLRGVTLRTWPKSVDSGEACRVRARPPGGSKPSVIAQGGHEEGSGAEGPGSPSPRCGIYLREPRSQPAAFPEMNLESDPRLDLSSPPGSGHTFVPGAHRGLHGSLPQGGGGSQWADSSLSRVLTAPAAVYLPVTNIPGRMVHFTKARKTTARGGH